MDGKRRAGRECKGLRHHIRPGLGKGCATEHAGEPRRNSICARATTDADAQAHRSEWPEGRWGTLHSHECESFPELIGGVGRSAIVAIPPSSGAVLTECETVKSGTRPPANSRQHRAKTTGGWTTTPEANVDRPARRYSIRADTGSTFVHKKYHPKLTSDAISMAVRRLGRARPKVWSDLGGPVEDAGFESRQPIPRIRLGVEQRLDPRSASTRRDADSLQKVYFVKNVLT